MLGHDPRLFLALLLDWLGQILIFSGSLLASAGLVFRLIFDSPFTVTFMAGFLLIYLSFVWLALRKLHGASLASSCIFRVAPAFVDHCQCYFLLRLSYEASSVRVKTSG